MANSTAIAALRSEAYALERSDSALDGLREQLKRWDYRFALEGLSVCERYLDFGLELAADLEIVAGGKNYHLCAIIKRAAPEVTAMNENVGGMRIGLGLVNEAIESANKTDGHQQFVFIDDVQIMDSSQRVVPSAIRFQRSDLIDYSGRGSVYMSLLDFRFKVISRRAEGEVNVLSGLSVKGDKIDGEIVKRRAQVVDSIADNGCEPIWQFLLGAQDDRVRVTFLLLDNRAVGLAIKELGDYSVKVCDMAVGPFYL